jgi:cytochrome c oxidase cbb3-type subunit 3
VAGLIVLLCGAAASPAQDAVPLEPFMIAPTFPAQQRAVGDSALIERGGTLYAIQCKGCHGPDLRGGDQGGPNLLRSPIVMGDKAGEGITPVIQNGRSGAGGGVMPALPLSDADAHAVAEYIHSVMATKQRQGGTPPVQVALKQLVGDARRGEKHFQHWCAGCHAASGDLAGVATRYPNPELLQNAWVGGRKPGLPAPGVVNPRRVVTVSLRFADGTQQKGQLRRLDDFTVSLMTDDGLYRSYVRRAATPAIVALDVDDPLARHRSLLGEYTDSALHDVTAYLATLK